MSGALLLTLVASALVDNIVFGAAIFGLGGDVPRVLPVALALYVAPSLVLAPVGSRLVDRFGVALTARIVKLGELIALAAVVWTALTSPSRALAYIAIAVFGVKAALFVPVKYAAAPRSARTHDALLRASMVVATSTVVAILIGMSAGYVAFMGLGLSAVASMVAVLAIAGGIATFFVREGEHHRPPARESSPRRAFLGIAWFWFFATTIVLTLPNDVRYYGALAGGFVAGALTVAWLSRGVLEIGVVPLGAGIATVFTALLAVGGFVQEPSHVHALVVLVGLGIACAWNVVPLYAFIHDRVRPEQSARVATTTDFVSTLAILVSALIAMYASLGRWTLPALAIINGIAALVTYRILPEFMLRFVAFVLAHIMYRIDLEGRENLPTQGPAVLVCNHVTFVDWLFIASATPVPIRFVMHYSFMKLPVARYVFRDAKLIPIAGAKEDADTLAKAFDAIADALTRGEIVCIFPEGKLTVDGKMNPFRQGIEKIIERTPAPVIPMALVGMWGSIFSKRPVGFGKRVRSSVRLIVAKAHPPSEVTAASLEAEVRALGNLT